MSSPINTGAFSLALRPGVYEWYGAEYPKAPEVWSRIFSQHKTGRSYEEVAKYNGFGLPTEKAQGDAISLDSSRQDYVTRYQTVAYGTGFAITKEMKEDDQYMIFAKNRTNDIRFAMDQGKEYVHAAIFNNTGIIGGDGKALFANDHPATSSSLFAISNTAGSAAALSETALEATYIQIRKAQNSRGLTIGIMPQTLHVPVELELEATVLTQSRYRVGGSSSSAPVSSGNAAFANQEVNPVTTMMNLGGGIVVNPYLTSTGKYYVHTNVRNGLKTFMRNPVELDVFDDNMTKNTVVTAYERYAVGWDDWMAAYQNGS
jgi:hypothetical protein